MHQSNGQRPDYYAIMGRWIMAFIAMCVIVLVFMAQGEWGEALLSATVAFILLWPLGYYAGKAAQQQAADEDAFRYRKRDRDEE